MPTLTQATSLSLEQLGARRVPTQPSIFRTTAPPAPLFGNNTQNSRCPVPPFSISPDSLSTYDASGLTPQARIIATLPLFQEATTGSSSTTTTTVVSGGGSTSTIVSSGASTSNTTTIQTTPTNIGFVTPAISGSVPYLASVAMSPLFLLYKVAVSSPARVELYATSASQTMDQGRPSSTYVSLGAENGIIGDFSLALSTESPWICSPVAVGYNGDNPVSSTIYITVTNLNATTVPITVTLFYLPLGD